MYHCFVIKFQVKKLNTKLIAANFCLQSQNFEYYYKARDPGASHDALTWRNLITLEELRQRYENRSHSYSFSGDSGYPQ